MRVAVLGCGAYGLALVSMLYENKCDIKVSSIEKDKLYNVNSQNVKFNVKANIDDISSDNIFAKSKQQQKRRPRYIKKNRYYKANSIN